jgi:hypothetical protein
LSAPIAKDAAFCWKEPLCIGGMAREPRPRLFVIILTSSLIASAAKSHTRERVPLQKRFDWLRHTSHKYRQAPCPDLRKVRPSVVRTRMMHLFESMRASVTYSIRYYLFPPPPTSLPRHPDNWLLLAVAVFLPFHWMHDHRRCSQRNILQQIALRLAMNPLKNPGGQRHSRSKFGAPFPVSTIT